MDEFYSEMQEVLNDLSPKESDTQSNLHSQDSGTLPYYFLGLFDDALILINSRRWLYFTAVSALTSDMPELGDKIQTPIDNLVVAREYLETAQSDLQWRARLWQVTEDTVSINLSSELGGELG